MLVSRHSLRGDLGGDWTTLVNLQAMVAANSGHLILGHDRFSTKLKPARSGLNQAVGGQQTFKHVQM